MSVRRIRAGGAGIARGVPSSSAARARALRRRRASTHSRRARARGAAPARLAGAPELRRRLVLGVPRARARARRQRRSTSATTARSTTRSSGSRGLRGLVTDALADAALEARYAIFERPATREPGRAHHASRLESWLAAAEAEPSRTRPRRCSRHLAGCAARGLRPRRRAGSPTPIRAAARSRSPRTCGGCTRTSGRSRTRSERARAPCTSSASTSPADASCSAACAQPADLAPTLERLCAPRAPRPCARRAGRVDAIELLVPMPDEDAVAGVAEAITPLLGRGARRASASRSRCVRAGRRPIATSPSSTRSATASRDARRPRSPRHPPRDRRAHRPRAAAQVRARAAARRPRTSTASTRAAREIPGDERLFVLADVRGRSPDEPRAARRACTCRPSSATSTRPTRCAAQPSSQLRDPRGACSGTGSMLSRRRRSTSIASWSTRSRAASHPATRHLGLEKVVVRLNVLDRARPEAPSQPVEIVFADPTGSRLELSWRAPHHEPLEPAQRLRAQGRRGAPPPARLPVRDHPHAHGRAGRRASSRASGALPGRHVRGVRPRRRTPTPPRAVSVAGRPSGAEHERDRVRRSSTRRPRRCRRACGAC